MLHVCMFVHTCAVMGLWMSGDNVQESVLSFTMRVPGTGLGSLSLVASVFILPAQNIYFKDVQVMDIQIKI